MTNKKKASIGAGDVEIELDGETRTLKQSLYAARAISSNSGGIMAALDSVGRMELDTYIQIIALGLGYKPGDAGAKEVPEKVFRTGMTVLTAPLSTYLSNLANGGRPLETSENSGGEEDENPQAA